MSTPNNTTREVFVTAAAICFFILFCIGASKIITPKELGPWHFHHAHHLHGSVTDTTATRSNKISKRKAKRPSPRPQIVRAVILENSTVTYRTLSTFQLSYIRPLDTVWINLDTHCIDDNSPNTMKAVLYTCNHKF